jgi:phytoene dehydrogenase-like protein
VFSLIDQYAPGFKDSIIYKDILAPPDLERVFGLTGTNQRTLALTRSQ